MGDRALGVLVTIDRALDDVAELADVTRPVVGLEQRLRRVAEAGPVRPFELGRHAPPEMLGEQGNVALAHAQRGQRDDLEAQAVEQIGTEATLVDQARQMFVGGGDDANIDLDGLGRADAGDLAIFDRAQQPVLRR